MKYLLAAAVVLLLISGCTGVVTEIGWEDPKSGMKAKISWGK
jgi:uncharacterized protein YceK